MHPRWINCLLFYFDLWGFCTQFGKSSLHQNFDRVVFILHIILASVCSISVTMYLRTFAADKLGTYNDSLKLCGILVVYWLSIFESYIQRHSQRTFWDIIHEIDKQFCSHRNLYFKTYLCKIILYYIISILMHLNYAYRLIIAKQSELYFFWFCYTIILLFYTNRLFYYLFFLEFIEHELNVINREIGQLLISYKSYGVTRTSFTKSFHRNRFKWIRKYFVSVHDMFSIINSVFGWSNVANILLPFLIFLADINWFYWRIFNKYRVDLIGIHHLIQNKNKLLS